MAQNGMFRNAFRGFNKQEVLQFIDEITAAWDEERKALQATADEAVAAQEAMKAQAEEAQAQAAAAAEQLQTAEDLLKELQQKVTSTAEDLAVAATTIEEMAIQLEEAQRRLAQLEQELHATADERDNAIAALADAKEQLAATAGVAQQLEDSRRQVSRQNEQINSMRQTISRYENVLGNADAVHEKVSGIVRPYIEQTAADADEALSDAQATLDILMTRLNDLQNGLDASRTALKQSTADSDARLVDALDDWLASAQDANGNSRHFFP
jgi:chromosome segregation ATPase